jgi:Glycosyltransferase sugar-binding region containing DXD motif/Methyltransferase domain
MRRIPKILHYCFGLDPSFGGKPWSLVHYVCVKSAIERINPVQTYIYYEYEPKGVWWDLTRRMLTPVRVNAPREIFGNAVQHVAHRADIVRLQTLIRQGGIYLDADVLVHQNFDDLLDNSVVLAEEGVGAKFGLGNAVIMAEPGAPFLKRWYEEYRSFRSKGHDDYWSEHSVRLPLILSRKYPNELTILSHTAFYWPLWTQEHLQLIYGSPLVCEQRASLANHLWESAVWEDYLEFLTPGKVRAIDSNFHCWARPLVSHLPDNYGRPSVADRCQRWIRNQKRMLAAWIGCVKRKFGRARQLGMFGTVYHFLSKTPLFLRRWRRRRIFQDVYKRKLWGWGDGAEFFSGEGSRGISAQTYVTRMSQILNERASNAKSPAVVVDLGCGDFEIGRRLIDEVKSIHYIGCDIVPELIARNSSRNLDVRVEFRRIDIVADELPGGDVCLIRQVLQHLSNDEIGKVMRKLCHFKKVYVTEAYPVEQIGPINPDKRTGCDVRYDWRNGRGRGVELDKEPFRLRIRELFRVSVDQRQVMVTFEVDCSVIPPEEVEVIIPR